MARVELNNNSYTQINTNLTDFLAQNHSPDVIKIIVATDQPAADADHQFQLERNDAISNLDVEGKLWGITTQAAKAFMGLKEG